MPTEPQRRVVITGMGAITSAGLGTAALEQALRGNTHRFRDVTLFSTEGLRVHIAGEVEEIPDSALAGAAARRRSSRSDRLALFAVEHALDSSGLDLSSEDRERIGTSIGTSTGGMLETEAYYDTRRLGTPAGRLRPQLLSSTVGAPTGMIASSVGAFGPRLGPSTACSSSAISLAMGLAWIRSGAADVVIAGGTDALCRMTYSGFHALKALAPEPCRPFDRDRQGLTLGEGAAAVVLEAEDHANERGAPVLARLLGAGLSCDANHPTAPHQEGLGASQALQTALSDAGVPPAEIEYVNAHGTGTPQNDACEARALRTVFGARASALPVSSTKGLFGHLLGAAGAVEAIATVLAMNGGFVPPTIGLTNPDPECTVDLIQGAPRDLAFRRAASNSYGFGGNNCSLILERP
ncbi:MAG: beta-ketoacyl-[acyl-carrier-protein] synthase family protein [Candidatus Binatia bacterium]|nr:beta-ketoacyl-[acyl-carrier-protein] synthase family protein [Candidatus Binatia bacterium]